MDDWNIDDFNLDSNMDGKWDRQAEMEVCFKTYDGTQHLRLHGWLKRNDVLIKMEQFTSEKERKTTASHFGSFIVYITEKTLENLKEENLEKGLFMDIEILSSGEKRFETWKGLDRVTKLDEGIKDFLFDIAGSISSPEDISRFVGRANETTLKLFKKDPVYITEYVETNEMSYKHKLKDLDLLIEYFEKQERYEDCALILKVKEKVQTRQLLTKLENNE
jgi:hypothetical protein